MPTTTPAGRRERARVRAARALELRMAGWPYAQIAAQVGYSGPGSAWKAVERALAAEEQAVAGDRERLRTEQNLRLGRLLAAVWNKAMKGDEKAVAQAVRLLERQARLLGLDAPVNVQISDRFDSEIEALLTEMGLNDDGAPVPSES